jgi:signal transduction histidine kinase/CheY-like chemotaxis protein
VPRISATVGDLQELLDRFVGQERARSLLTEYAANSGRVLPPNERADPELLRFTERLLAGALGAASARLVMASMLRGRDMQLEDVVRLLDETSHVIQFNRELLRATLEHLPQGVSVVDAELRLVAWNPRYLELFHYPPSLVTVGRPIEELMRYNASQGLLGGGNLEAAVRRRLAHMRAGHAHSHERELPDGTVLEILGNPMPGGGFVTSYSDVTAHKRTARALLESNEMLEVRVAQRTHELTMLNAALAKAKADADRANYSKTRFLAAASHDLVQPITAARLFMSSIDRSDVPQPPSALIVQAENALTTAEGLLAGLLDISRLDAGAEEVRLEHFELATLLEPLAAEFKVLARDRGLMLRLANCRQVVYSDARLLRRVLQNFLSNGVRYTRKGRVLIGCRRGRQSIRIEVWDSGPGIPPDKQAEIFEEFRRLDTQGAGGERGLGLGLTIAERIARVLGHPLSLRSWPGRGSVFAITVPLGDRGAISPPARVSAAYGPDRMAGSVVMCLENEPAVLFGLQTMLCEWGCEVLAVRDRESALASLSSTRVVPHLLLVDYHLDGGISGIVVAKELQAQWGGEIPSIIITADHTQDAKRAANAQGYQVLPKPIKPAALRALMNRMLA